MMTFSPLFTSKDIKLRSTEIQKHLNGQQKNIPNLSSSEIKHLNDDGIVTVGTFVRPGDILVGKLFRTILLNNYLSLSYYELFWSKGKGVK
jgi:DNA-directed RNA polymerase beta subunit